MKWIALAVLCLFVVLMNSEVGDQVLPHLSDRNWLSDYLLVNGYLGHTYIAVAALFFIGVGGPKQVIALLFGYLYGPYLGVLSTLLTCVTAALANYMAARVIFARTLARVFPQRMSKFNQYAGRAPFMKILALRLLPVGNNLVTNLLSGSVGVPLAAFLFASVLGYLPQVFIFCMIGFGVNDVNHAVIYISLGVALCSCILTALIYRDHLKFNLTALNIEGQTE